MKVKDLLTVALLGTLTATSAHALDLIAGLPEYDCYNEGFQHSTLKTGPALLELKTSIEPQLSGQKEYLTKLLGEGRRVAGFRISNDILQSCLYLAHDDSIFTCDFHNTAVDLLDRKGNVLATVPGSDYAFIHISSGLGSFGRESFGFSIAVVDQTKSPSERLLTLDSGPNLSFEISHKLGAYSGCK